MGRVVVIEFVTLDGIVSDPDGSGGTPSGGWAFRHGPESVAGDKFRLGTLMDDGVMLLGRSTWELFTRIWPHRTDDFSVRMNKMAKLVASHTLTDVSAWSNSELLDGELTEVVERETRDVVVTGSLTVVRALQQADLIDEYRLLTFPSIIGTGEKLFPPVDTPVHLTLVSADRAGAAVLATYARSERQG
jgi:dihydrofolate reductase